MAQEVNEEKFINGNLNKLMFSMAIPTIVAQVINILYNIVDRVYIGHIPGASVDALTGVGVALPYIKYKHEDNCKYYKQECPVAKYFLCMFFITLSKPY